MGMSPRLGEVITQARQARRLTLRRLADQVLKEDGTPISPRYLFDIKVHHRVPAPYVLRELARVLELTHDAILPLAGAVDTVVREYLAAHPEHAAAIIKLFRAAQQREFHDWDQLLQHLETGSTRDSEQVRPC